MGLDITAHQNVTFVDCVFDAGGDAIDPVSREYLDDVRLINVNRDFPSRSDELKDGACFTSDKAYGFRAGSYSGYNWWREELAKLAGYPLVEYHDGIRAGQMRHDAGAWKSTGGPFWELILFSDCEGCVGPKTSDKLAKDFADFQERADKHEDDRWRALYAEWRKAFEMASQNGLVDFH